MASPTTYPFAGAEWTVPFRIGAGSDFEAFTDSILFTPAAGAGTTHSVTAAVMAFTGQSVTSSAATVHSAGAASMAYSGQAVTSSNATVHAVTAAAMNYAGQSVAIVKATVHAVTAAVTACTVALLLVTACPE